MRLVVKLTFKPFDEVMARVLSVTEATCFISQSRKETLEESLQEFNRSENELQLEAFQKANFKFICWNLKIEPDKRDAGERCKQEMQARYRQKMLITSRSIQTSQKDSFQDGIVNKIS